MIGSPIVCIIISLVPRTIEAHYVYAVIVCGVEMMEGRKGERQGGRKQKRKVEREGGRKGTDSVRLSIPRFPSLTFNNTLSNA